MKNPFKRDSRETTINKEIDVVVNKLIQDHTDEELSYMVVAIRNRSISYLKHRKETLNDQIETIKDYIDQADYAIKTIEG